MNEHSHATMNIEAIAIDLDTEGLQLFQAKTLEPRTPHQHQSADVLRGARLGTPGFGSRAVLHRRGVPTETCEGSRC